MHRRLTDYESAAQALADLCDGLVAFDAVDANWHTLAPQAVPEEARRLLVHHEHMTTTLQAHHDGPVNLRVLGDRLDGDLYRRKIVLTLEDTDRIVEFGIVRIDLGFVPAAVRNAILDRRTPLGEALIGNDVMRRIEPRWYLRFPAPCVLLAGSGVAASGELYGRIGTIYCDREPAIELLEIVTGLGPQ